MLHNHSENSESGSTIFIKHELWLHNSYVNYEIRLLKIIREKYEEYTQEDRQFYQCDHLSSFLSKKY